MIRVLLATLLLFAASPSFAEITIEFASGDPRDRGALVVGALDGAELMPAAKALDRRTSGHIERALEKDGFTGGPQAVITLTAPPGTDLDRAVIVGLGAPGAKSTFEIEEMAGRAMTAVLTSGSKRVTFAIDSNGLNGVNSAEMAARIALGAKLASYRFHKYVQPGSGDRVTVERITVMTDDVAAAEARYAGLKGVADAVTLARDLVSEPANVIYPQSFVDRARVAFDGIDDVSIDVLDEDDMLELKMGALLGVGQGSQNPPRLLVVTYRGARKSDPLLAFVGKGVTFDTGGISIKSSDRLWRMKFDMAGAAATIGVIKALADRDARVNAVGVAALVENMPSAKAQRPGDVVLTMSGKTIEVINTDAEGRLILADAVWYTQSRLEPAVLIDLATLTGSVRRALGTGYAGLFSNDDQLARQLLAAGERAGEPLWRLPLGPAHNKEIASNIADIKNTGDSGGAGASIGAAVIGTFIRPGQSWAHLDIANMAWRDSGQATVPSGASGFGVRLLNQWVADNYEKR